MVAAHEHRDALKLNPYLEIVQGLGIVNTESGYQHDCYMEWVDDLGRRRPELKPFLDAAMALLPVSLPLSDWSLQDRFRKLFGYAVPGRGALAAIAKLGPRAVEIGAGTGYWSAMLAGMGVEVLAFDNGSWKLRPLWYNVKRGGAPMAGKVEADTLLLCWPPYDTPMGYSALKAFRGPNVAYVGEGAHGCTGCSRFHNLLDREWQEVDCVPIYQYRGSHDRCYIYRRNGDA